MGAGPHGVAIDRRVWGAGVSPAPRQTMTLPDDSTAERATLDDAALVRAFLAGERAAFDAIVARHQRAVYHVCYRFVRNHEDAADLAQDVFVRAFKGLQHFKGDARLSTWLYRVAVNVCLNRAASRKPDHEPLDPARHVDDRADDPLRAVVRGERAAAVRHAIAQLPPKQRATVLLRVYQDLPHEEIARILGSTEGAVKTNFFHALGNLRRLLTR